MNYILHYDIASIFIIITIMIYFFVKKNVNTRLTHLFSVFIICTLVAAFLDMLDCYTTNHITTLPAALVFLVKEAYLITFDSTAAIYFAYIVYSAKGTSKIRLRDRLFILIPIIFNHALILTNPLTKKVFYFDLNGVYHFGPFMVILYLIEFYYVIGALLLMIYYRRNLTATQKASVYFFTCSSALAVLIQMLYPTVLLSLFAVSISALLIYLSLENPDNYEDKSLGTYNREAFLQIVAERISREHDCKVLGIQLHGFKYINDIIGVTNGNYLLKDVSDFLMSNYPGGKIFHVSGVKFAILLKDNITENQTSALIEQISQRFDRPFYIHGMELLLSCKMCVLHYPENVKTIEDILDSIEYSLSDSKQTNNASIIYDSSTILQSKRRETMIIQIMKQAFMNNSYEVYYQPIYSVEKESYTSAEALIRLKDSRLGFISPEEFIPIAERNGLILQLGELVFSSVCQFIIEEKVAEKGIKYIEINLSVVQCMQESLCEKLMTIMDYYQVPHQMINLEITETAAVISTEILLNNMQQLIQTGVHFSMDDYGTGFSNISHIIEYPFSLIKFDKSMIWASMNSEKAFCALKHNVSMIKELHMKIVAEGVETEEQAAALKELGCDYFQGYHFSKPVPKDEFISLLS